MAAERWADCIGSFQPDRPRFLFGLTQASTSFDSDNNDGYGVARTDYEDEIEEDDDKPGKIILANTGDVDGDGIPDFADGFDRDDETDNDDDTCEGAQFYELKFDWPFPDSDEKTVTIGYDASDPKQVTYNSETGVYTPAAGAMRLWLKDGGQARSVNDANEEEEDDRGDYVPPGEYNSAKLGLSGPGTVTFYVEGIAASAEIGDYEISAYTDDEHSDLVRATVIKMEFVTKADDGSTVPQNFFFNCVPNPVISVASDSCSIAADGTVSVYIAGTVTDAASDLVDDPMKQLDTLSVYAGSELVHTINLTNNATPEYPWKPYNYEASFSTGFTIPTGGFGEYHASLETSTNVAGCASILSYDVSVDIKRESTTCNIVLSGDFDEDLEDDIVFYVGDYREGVENEILHETDVASLDFTNELFWADVEAQVVSFGGLTENIDVLRTYLKFNYSGGKFDEYELDFVETEPESGHFTAVVFRPIDGTALGGLLNLVLPEVFSGTTNDMLITYVGDRDPAEGDFQLTETTASSLVFNGNASWGDTTVEIIDFAGLTEDPDTIATVWTITHPDGTQEVLGK